MLPVSVVVPSSSPTPGRFEFNTLRAVYDAASLSACRWAHQAALVVEPWRATLTHACGRAPVSVARDVTAVVIEGEQQRRT